MAELVVVGFKNDRYRAAAVLGEIRAADEPWSRELHGAIAVYRDDHGDFTVDQSFEATKGGSVISGALVGSLLGIAVGVVALPVTASFGPTVSASTIAASGISGLIVGARRNRDRSFATQLDIPPDFLDVLRGIILMNDSAIFVRRRTPLQTEAARELAQKFRPYGGTVLRAMLTDQAPRARVPSHQY